MTLKSKTNHIPVHIPIYLTAFQVGFLSGILDNLNGTTEDFSAIANPDESFDEIMSDRIRKSVQILFENRNNVVITVARLAEKTNG